MAYPATGCQKCFEIDDDLKLRHFYEKRMAQETEADCLGDEWKVSFARTVQRHPVTHGSVTRACGRFLTTNSDNYDRRSLTADCDY